MQRRPISNMPRMRFTKAGYEKLKEEYAQLKAERPGVLIDVQKARDLGDLKENGYYQASKAKLRTMDSRLMHLSYNIKTAKIIEEGESETVVIGSTVTLANEDREMTYQFVGDLEANPSEKKLSLLSPIGKAVEGKKVGEKVEIQTPAGNVSYIVKKIA